MSTLKDPKVANPPLWCFKAHDLLWSWKLVLQRQTVILYHIELVNTFIFSPYQYHRQPPLWQWVIGKRQALIKDFDLKKSVNQKYERLEKHTLFVNLLIYFDRFYPEGE